MCFVSVFSEAPMYIQYGCNVTAVRRSVTLVNSLLALRHEEG